LQRREIAAMKSCIPPGNSASNAVHTGVPAIVEKQHGIWTELTVDRDDAGTARRSTAIYRISPLLSLCSAFGVGELIEKADGGSRRMHSLLRTANRPCRRCESCSVSWGRISVHLLYRV
jgi:hypothetical protein